LIIRFSALGDVAMTIPLIRAFKKAFPEVEVSVLSKPLPLKLFLPERGLNNISFDSKKYRGILGLWKLSREVVAKGITDVADLHFSLRSRILCFFLRLNGLNTSQRNKQRRLRARWTKKEPKPKERLDTQVQSYLKVLSSLGFKIEEPMLRSSNEVARSKKPTKKIGVAPFAAHPHKTYPKDLMRQLLIELNKKYRTVLFGADGTESKQFDQWVSEGIAYENTAMLSFEAQMQKMSDLGLMISMDSANGHIAANYGLPVITLWGATTPDCGFSVFGQPEENQMLPDPVKYPYLPASIFGKSTFPGYESAMKSIDQQAIIERVNQLMLP
jgi:ADP-heptose:LPS heptosyltransferase